MEHYSDTEERLTDRGSSDFHTDADDAPLGRCNTTSTAVSPTAPLWTRFIRDIQHMRWRVLVLMCLVPYGGYWFYDVPGAIGTGTGATIQRHFQDGGKPYSQADNLLLYSVYGYVNIVMAFVWGIVVEKYLGIRRTFILGATVVVVSSGLFYVGVVARSYALIVTARIIYGLGGESITVSQGAMVSRWFKEGTAFPLGWTIALLRVAGASTFFFSPLAANSWSVPGACLLAFFAAIFSLIIAVTLNIVDRRSEQRGEVAVESVSANASVRLLDIVLLPKQAVVVAIVSMLLYASLWPFLNVAVTYFEVRYGTHEDTAGSYVAIFQAGSAIGSPLAGLVVDRTGRFTQWFIAAGLGMALCHVLFVAAAPPIPLMMLLISLAYCALQSSVWPVIPWAVPFNLIGVGFGLTTSLFNLGSAITPTVVGAVLDSYTNESDIRVNNVTGKREPALPSVAGFNVVLGILAGIATCGVLAAGILCCVDRGGVLSVSVATREEILGARAEAAADAVRQDTEALEMEMQ